MANSQKSEVDQKRDEALRRMLNTPHKPHVPARPKKVRAAKKKTARKS